MKKLTSLTLLLLSATILTACGGGDGVGDNSDSDSQYSDLLANVQGVWVKSCGPVDDDGEIYDIITITLDQNRGFSDIKNYVDSDCSTPLEFSPNPQASYTFDIVGTVTTTDGLEAIAVNSQILTFNGAPFDAREYDIIFVEGDNFYSGLEGAGLTPEERPDSIDFDRLFVRQK